MMDYEIATLTLFARNDQRRALLATKQSARVIARSSEGFRDDVAILESEIASPSARNDRELVSNDGKSIL